MGALGTGCGLGTSIGGNSASAGAGLGTAGGLAAGFAAEVGFGLGGLAPGGSGEAWPVVFEFVDCRFVFVVPPDAAAANSAAAAKAYLPIRAQATAQLSVCRSLAKLAR